MLTDRGRWILAFGGGVYLAAWGFGSEVLYPIALGLVLAVAAAALWVRFLSRPITLNRILTEEKHVAGDDIPVRLEVDVEGRIPSGTLVIRERIARLGERETVMVNRRGRLRGSYVIGHVPRGRYPVESVDAVLEDPFGLERVELKLLAGESLLVYPSLVELDALFSDSGARALEGRRLLLRRPTGFDLHSVRDYQQGESLRRVHWPTTARRGHLMVKELEDAPRDEVLVVLDAQSGFGAGDPPDSSFDAQVRVAGSILWTHARRGRHARLFVTSTAESVAVRTYEHDWRRALEALAAAEQNGRRPLEAFFGDAAGDAARASDLVVVTAALRTALVEAVIARAASRQTVSVVYVDLPSFDGRARRAAGVESGVLRLEAAGMPVAVVRRGDDLAGVLATATERVALG